MKENNNQVIYVVKAFYDMNINAEEEIIVECYATEELAQRRVRQLMRDFARDIAKCLDLGGWEAECARHLISEPEQMDITEAEAIMQVIVFGEVIYG